MGGLFAGAAALATIGHRHSRRWLRLSVALALGIGLGALAFDGLNALFFDLRYVGVPHLYTPDLRVRFGTGSNSLQAQTFGVLTSSSDLLNTPRQLQLALKMYF